MATNNGKQKSKQVKNQIEALKDTPQEIARSFSDFAEQGVSSLWEQMLGNTKEPQAKTSGDLNEGQELDVQSLKKKEEAKKVNIEPGLDYAREIIHGARKIEQQGQQEIEVKIQEIIIELKKLIASSAELKDQFKEVASEQRITKAGKYHLSFFEWMLTAINDARLKVEDAGTWLKAMGCKKGKQGYWQMFKKHGTSFGLSNERVVATQTG